MIAHWMSDPVYGTKTGCTKLAKRVEADRAPKTPAKPASSTRNRKPHLR